MSDQSPEIARFSCGEVSDDYLVCTLPPGHAGAHEAWGITRCLQRWSGVPQIVADLRRLNVPEEVLRPIIEWDERVIRPASTGGES